MDETDRDGISEDDVTNLIMAFAVRHGLSKVALKDLLELLGTLGATAKLPSSCYYLLQHFSEYCAAHELHFYCTKCLSYIERDASCCSSCEERFCKKSAVRTESYFIYIPLEDQLRALVEGSSGPKTFARGWDFSSMTLDWNFDGVPVHKSSASSLWPILCTVNELLPEKKQQQLIVCALWHGTMKPRWGTVSKPFLKELGKLSEHGFSWIRDGVPSNTKVSCRAIVCDSPARSMVQCTHQFNGAFGCSWCMHEGEVVPKGNGFVRVYPYKSDVTAREHSSTLESARKVHETSASHHNGVKGASSLFLLPKSAGVDVVNSFAVDYMHAVLLGVVRQFLELWFGSKYSDEAFSVRKQLSSADQILLGIKPPEGISRTPRTLVESCRWKASECRSWLLYYSVPVMDKLLSVGASGHWCQLVTAVFLLLQGEMSSTDLNKAQSLLASFVAGTARIYGVKHMSFNVHSLMHLGSTARRFGPLWNCSAFPYEGYMMRLSSFIHGTTNVVSQTARNYEVLERVKRHLNSPMCGLRARATASKWLPICPPLASQFVADGFVGLGRAKSLQLRPNEARLLQGLVSAEDGVSLSFERAIVNGEKICTKNCGMETKRNSYTLFTRYGLGQVRNITLCSGHCVIFIRVLNEVETPFPTILPHVSAASGEGALMACTPSEVEGTAVVVELKAAERTVFICSKRPNKIEKD